MNGLACSENDDMIRYDIFSFGTGYVLFIFCKSGLGISFTITTEQTKTAPLKS